VFNLTVKNIRFERVKTNEQFTEECSEDSRVKLLVKKYWKFALGIVVALGLMTFLIIRSNPESIWLSLVNANIGLIFGAIGCTFLLFIIKTIRWQLILKPHGYNIPFLQALRLVLIGTFGSSITPAKIGDVLRAVYLSKEKKEIKIGLSVFSVVFDRLLDLTGIFIIVGISVPVAIMKIGFDVFELWIPAAIGGGFLIFIVLLVAVFNGKITKPVLNFILKFISKIFKKKNAKNKIEITSQEIIDDFYENQKNYLWWHYVILATLSVVFWILLGLQGSILLEAFSIEIFNSVQNPIIVIAVLCVAAIAAMAIPISISGIGVRDAVIMLLLDLLIVRNSMSSDLISVASINLSILQTFMNVLLPGIIGGLLIILSSKSLEWQRKMRKKELKA